ncbi:hypothetical protein AN480_29825 (plasmid) [Mycobacterium intracellulare subsp. chimaera]|nr:hypothetical protein AN480_29825 [Mycobacterium intracellulare subsp. chimaera]
MNVGDSTNARPAPEHIVVLVEDLHSRARPQSSHDDSPRARQYPRQQLGGVDAFDTALHHQRFGLRITALPADPLTHAKDLISA